jgi:hypothetical protein
MKQLKIKFEFPNCLDFANNLNFASLNSLFTVLQVSFTTGYICVHTYDSNTGKEICKKLSDPVRTVAIPNISNPIKNRVDREPYP